MKKLLSLTIAAGALAMVMASCGGNSASDGELRLESYAFDVISASTDSVPSMFEGADRLRSIGEGVLPMAKEGSKLKSLRDSLQKLAGMQITEKGEAAPLPMEGFTPTAEKPDSTEACNYWSNKLSITLITPRVAVWSDEASFYPCGAAHPLHATNYVNYDRENNRILSLADLMKPDYEEPLAKQLREKLQDMDVDLLVALESVGVPDTFNITRDGITFTYGLYSIAPYSAGEISVRFYAWELSDVLTDEGYSLIMGAKL